MQADAGEGEAGQFVGFRAEALVVGTVDAGHHAGHVTRLAGPAQHVREVLAEGFVVDMRVGVDQFHVFPYR